MATVLVTGATGFVGGATAWRLLRDVRVERLVLLVRGDGAEARVRRSVERFGPVPQWSRVQVLEGDLNTQLEPALIDDVTHVIHAAACTSFRSTHTVHRVNVEQTLAFAEQLERARNLLRFVHVGTAFSCGVVKHPLVREDTRASSEHVVEYTRSKAHAEARLLELNLPLVVARPSVVIGHTRLGVAPSTSLYWYYRALAEAGVSPFAAGRHRDIVPVDYVADALTHLSFTTLRHRCYHVSAGEGSARPWGEIRAAFGSEALTELVPADELATHPAWQRLDVDETFRAALELVARFSTIGIEWFVNQRLIDSGMPPPTPFTEYLPRCRESSSLSVRAMLSDDA